ncbi:uncharacterized protein LOC125553265 [Triticum urartu]|uniref:uncharacterized protein LOC125553265 n=1 Tax=Triticum urartu TaxID=4572 RepID=UPI002043EF4C|nr:uncharacterized protein LOC125553265 [Triticum urartu]
MDGAAHIASDSSEDDRASSSASSTGSASWRSWPHKWIHLRGRRRRRPLSARRGEGGEANGKGDGDDVQDLALPLGRCPSRRFLPRLSYDRTSGVKAKLLPMVPNEKARRYQLYEKTPAHAHSILYEVKSFPLNIFGTKMVVMSARRSCAYCWLLIL